MTATRVKCPRPEHAGSRARLNGTLLASLT
jgi:hypothetical protein